MKPASYAIHKLFTVEACDCDTCYPDAKRIGIVLSDGGITSLVTEVKDKGVKHQEHFPIKEVSDDIQVGDIVNHKLTGVSVEMVVYSIDTLADNSVGCRWWYDGGFYEKYFNKKELIKQ